MWIVPPMFGNSRAGRCSSSQTRMHPRHKPTNEQHRLNFYCVSKFDDTFSGTCGAWSPGGIYIWIWRFGNKVRPFFPDFSWFLIAMASNLMAMASSTLIAMVSKSPFETCSAPALESQELFGVTTRDATGVLASAPVLSRRPQNTLKHSRS